MKHLKHLKISLLKLSLILTDSYLKTLQDIGLVVENLFKYNTFIGLDIAFRTPHKRAYLLIDKMLQLKNNILYFLANF